MRKRKILETERLYLRELELNDYKLIYQLLNSPDWLKYIGDKKIRTNVDAKYYLKNGPLKSYKENGFGLWLVQMNVSKVQIGICGLINRETLDDIEIGFALLPIYYGLGYGFEIATATMKYAKNTLSLNKIIAITDPSNTSSIKLLNKIGLHFEKTLDLPEDDTVLLFSSSSHG